MHYPAPGCGDVLVALIGPSHAESCVHVNVVTGQIQGDKTLEQESPARPSGGEENKKTGGGAAICHHVQHRSKFGRLFKVSSGISIKSIEETGDAV
jgi:hypothetical protein